MISHGDLNWSVRKVLGWTGNSSGGEESEEENREVENYNSEGESSNEEGTEDF